MRSTLIIGLGLSLAASATAGTIDIVEQIRLLDGTGAPLNGPLTVSVSLVDDNDPALPESACFTASLGSVIFADGYATLPLADVPIDCFQAPTWIAVTIDGSELGPRLPSATCRAPVSPVKCPL